MGGFLSFLKIMIMFLIFTSCGSRSLEDFKEEGEGIVRSLIQDLRLIHTREQLIVSSGRLKRQFERLVDIMIAAKEYRDSHPEQDLREIVDLNHELNDQFKIELYRVYRIEGGRQIIEKCQEKALYRLDTFEKEH